MLEEPPTLYLNFEDSMPTSGQNRFAFRPPRIVGDAEFREFCEQNPTLRIERYETGEVIIMPPAGWDTGVRNSEIVVELVLWNRQHGEPGYVADSSAGYHLPNGRDRSPDASWVRRDRIEALSPEQRTGYLPLCPDFVVELMSPTDSLKATQDKMEEYITCGAVLGFLIDRKQRIVTIYRPGKEPKELTAPSEVSGSPELPGFVLSLERIF